MTSVSVCGSEYRGSLEPDDDTESLPWTEKRGRGSAGGTGTPRREKDVVTHALGKEQRNTPGEA